MNYRQAQLSINSFNPLTNCTGYTTVGGTWSCASSFAKLNTKYERGQAGGRKTEKEDTSRARVLRGLQLWTLFQKLPSSYSFSCFFNFPFCFSFVIIFDCYSIYLCLCVALTNAARWKFEISILIPILILICHSAVYKSEQLLFGGPDDRVKLSSRHKIIRGTVTYQLTKVSKYAFVCRMLLSPFK